VCAPAAILGIVVWIDRSGGLDTKQSDCLAVALFASLMFLEQTVAESMSDIANQLLSEVDAIREILAQHGRLTIDVASLDNDADLYSAGLTSLATVGIMLAIEDRFDIEFPESMLSRKTFKSVAAITEAVTNLAS
jgi:acyl carrier protein